MRIVLKCLLVALASLFTACPAQEPVTVGKLEVKISGLPSGTNASVNVTGPAGFKQALTATKTLSDLTAGSYSVTAANVTAGGKNYGASVTGTPATVTAGGSSSASVVYGALRTITGKLLNGAGQPVTAASLTGSGTTLSVKLLGSSVTIAVDATGGFTLADVPATYSLAVLVFQTQGQNGRIATVYQGLTRANPTLTIFASGQPVETSNAPVEGKITGGLGFPTTSITSTWVALTVPKAVSPYSNYFSPVDASTGSYFTSATWLGSDPVAANLQALQFSADNSGKIMAYHGYVQQSINLTKQVFVPGQPTVVTKQDLALLPVTVGNVKGAITWPTGITTPEYDVNTIALLGGSNPIGFPLSPANGSAPVTGVAPTGFDQLVPLVAGAKFMQIAGIREKTGSGSFGSRVSSTVWKSVTSGANTDITVPTPVDLTLPGDATSQVGVSTTFSWKAFTGGVHRLSVYPSPPGATPIGIQVITAGSSTTIPDLSAYGFSLSESSIHVWYVEGFAPYSSIDAATDTAGLKLPFSSTPLSDTAYSTSATRSFITAP